ncbi:MAG: hypothetical protein LBE35_01185, partial [Clostridiales bacterium]|nr:hypothetical protein [Clostridiales bacterium]
MQIAELTERHAIEISRWRYEGEYAIYDEVPWEEMVRDGWALANPEKRRDEFLAFLNDDGVLVAYTRRNFKEHGIMLGIGANPEFLSMGYGSRAIGLATERI